MFIDQLVMIQEKTRGNLTTEESTVLRNALASLQMAYVEASQGGHSAAAPPETVEAAPAPAPESAPASAEAESATSSSSPAAAPESESKKKFTKSYGA